MPKYTRMCVCVLKALLERQEQQASRAEITSCKKHVQPAHTHNRTHTHTHTHRSLSGRLKQTFLSLNKEAQVQNRLQLVSEPPPLTFMVVGAAVGGAECVRVCLCVFGRGESIRAAGARCDDRRSQGLKIEVCSQREREGDVRGESGEEVVGGGGRSLTNNASGLPREDDLTSEHKLLLNEVIDLPRLPRV